jgi:serpin B
MKRAALCLLLTALPLSADSFSIALYKRAAKDGGNVVLSPYSVSSALQMLRDGARGATAKEITDTLGNTPKAKAITKSGSGFELVSANALWAMQGRPLRAEYVAQVKKDYGAAIEPLNFANGSAAAARINGWVSEQTRGKIPTIIGADALNANTRLVLTNAVYMKAKWERQFSKGATRDQVFHLAPGRDVQVKTMTLTRAPFRLGRFFGGRVLELPYQGGELSMLVFLPDAIDGLAAIESKLDAALAAKLMPAKVDVFLPRFHTTKNLNLNEQLQAMGIRRAFRSDGSADFSGISTTEKLFVSRALHNARIDVDEEGTEAAAATAMTVERTSADLNKPEVFRVDRPFLFLIRGKSGEIFFIGRIMDPTR